MFLPTTCLGLERLRDVHKTVDKLLDKLNYNEKQHVQVYNLCTHCETVEDLDRSVPMEKKKLTYLHCSGYDWICRAIYEVERDETILWTQYSLMTPQEYCELITEAMETMEPRSAMFSIHKFNKDLRMEQPHTVNTIHAVEELLFKCYVPLKLQKNRLPVPPEGKEFLEEIVAPMNIEQSELVEPTFKESWVPTCSCPEKSLDPETEACTQCGNSKLQLVREKINTGDLTQMPDWDPTLHFLDEEKDMVDGNAAATGIQRDLDIVRARALVSNTCTEMINHISTHTGIKDPCQFCQTKKRSAPDRIVECSGVEELCTFKHEFFKAWPVGMVRDKSYNEIVLSCYTVAKYKDILDQVFSLKYVERAMNVKRMIDTDLLPIHPHLAPVANLYNCILYRYYWPSPLERIPSLEDVSATSDAESELSELSQ